MQKPLSGYILGIGSNIVPEENIALIIKQLLKEFTQLTLSRVLKIPPVGMNSQLDFFNVIVFIETDIPQTELKAFCNKIEIQLGRDRNDPERQTKDRTADLDILTKAHFPEDYQRPTYQITDEYFLYPLLEEITAYLSQSEYSISQPGIPISIDDLTFGQTATTINWNARTSHKRVI